ncbi:2,3,4,5-tetrahydropyridine-2,6-dicarboxylate N-acetyltransferase [Frankliniella fusca]|nr:2,3,4,5-tetrahydropyridine-2,6-dicarboxylate N-acetyltransferase [Frankliniella fusca]
MNVNLISNLLQSHLEKEGVSTDKVSDILKTCVLPAMQPIETLSTSYRRKKYYKKYYEYVRPVKQPLGRNKFFYYVPVQKTLLASFKNKSVKIVLSPPESFDDGVLRDFTDGLAYKRNQFFIDNPTALRLILFQDAFQIVCPIGFAKKKYKILAVYMSIGNLPDYLRSHVKSFHLIALCKDRELNHELVFGRIVKDLLDIEKNGLYVPGVGLVKAGLAFIAGDNLGSHAVGGFNENFSKSIYFCRYCTVDRKTFFSNDGPFLTYPQRTPAVYRECLLGENITTKKGVKFDSEFNKLSSFHVCDFGLPPCYAHDCYEGFAKYDMALFIHYFVGEEWFTYEDLNNCIESFPYSEAHRRDKPQPFEEKFKHVKGKAWSIHILILLFPLIMKNFILNAEDEVWKCFLLLAEIVEILCSPTIHESYVPYLRGLIFEYIQNRIKLFPTVELRPKHHYFMHYPELILMFGPLMRVWTLRFESKHCFFCRCAKFSRQFKNILLSLSVRHELHQAFIRCGSDGFSSLQYTKSQAFLFEAFCPEIQEAVRGAGLSLSIRACCKVSFKGTKYCKGEILALNQSYYQEDIVFGRISLILITPDESLFFLVETLQSIFVPHIRAYSVIGSSLPHYKCVKHNDILAYFPLHNYKIHNGSYIRLKHALIAKPL